MNVILERARPEDSDDIAQLINVAYRGDTGWTTEAKILTGNRVTTQIINTLINDTTIHFLVAYNLGDLLCCICVEQAKKTANIGYFSVNPKLQGLGIGSSVLEQAEHYAANILNVTTLALQVVSKRPELLDYYLRRDYKKTGLVKPFPTHLKVGEPKIKGLTIECLEKKI